MDEQQKADFQALPGELIAEARRLGRAVAYCRQGQIGGIWAEQARLTRPLGREATDAFYAIVQGSVHDAVHSQILIEEEI